MEAFVLVIGGGQAGLAAGYYLRKAGIPLVIVDERLRSGDNWRVRYNSLVLFTPRQFSSLPGLEMEGNRESYPSRLEFADYLEAYASHFALPIKLGRQVANLTLQGQGVFEAALDSGEKIAASSVIVATGAFQRAVVPEVASQFGREVLQLTAETYLSPRQLPDGPVLVVGDGASGRDIAVDCLKTNPVFLAVGKPRRLFPERIFGKSIWWWLKLAGILKAPAESFIGRKVKRADAFPDRNRSVATLKRLGVRIVSRLTAAVGSEAKFSDGSSAVVRTVIWATGYRDDSSWLAVPGATTPNGSFIHDSGRSPIKGLYFVGRPWQRNRASALVMGAGPDADVIVQQVLRDN